MPGDPPEEEDEEEEEKKEEDPEKKEEEEEEPEKEEPEKPEAWSAVARQSDDFIPTRQQGRLTFAIVSFVVAAYIYWP